MQGSIFGVSFDFSCNENGLHIIHIIHIHTVTWLHFLSGHFDEQSNGNFGRNFWCVTDRLTTCESDFTPQVYSESDISVPCAVRFCVCVWFNLRGLFNLMPQSDVPGWPWRRHIWKYCVFEMCVCFYSTGSTQQERRYLTVYTPLTDHVSRGLVCSNVARHPVAQRNQRSTTNYQLLVGVWL